MAQEWAMVTVGVIASISTLAGAGLNWLLSNITAESTARRAEKQDLKKSLEERYLAVQLSLERFVRSTMASEEMDEEFARLNSIMVIFANEEVRATFRDMADSFRVYEKCFKESEKQYYWVSSASEDHPQEWKDFLDAMKKVGGAMRNHISSIST
ncbi:hypothetical protein [Pseudomonas putida]|uniref:hypothetical protein n=1 Tax=Pseudomonas putida TaxID=303 RepID=UPI0008194B24|nr:hypothetical protein [Pseudomonas putida]OCT28234.1 hypothetical protein A6E20_26410 [Pseudomonas putida]OCT31798.1 hypothetical protein A6E24_26460 [Pseudomonas putida]OCT41576.1 hypothetical protein A6E19_23945 [Pseudomonas putida]